MEETMIRGFYASQSGLLGQQQNMNVIANNFANIGTYGYKPQHAAFSSLIYAKVHGGGGTYVNTGHGSRVHSVGVNYAQAGFVSTGIPTDMAINGEGFFAVAIGEEDEVYYTRDGGFRYSVDGDTKSLVDANGGYVLDSGGNRIEMPGDEEADPSQVGVFVFPNRHGLELKGMNRLAATEVSGEAEALEEPDVRAGYLERSGVGTSEEVVRMIEASRAFSFNARVLQTIDEMEGVGNQLRTG
ncbi:MAG: flagellar hook-basal body protein [Clostridiales Family XIII bacterium]|jgi:flagellar basal body rod protein FlgG|nr:flagellar hook-basal body protein [Clostridiales Family XIII bacterium]